LNTRTVVTCVYLCIHVYMNVYVYINVYIYVCICMYVHTYTHEYVHIHRKRSSECKSCSSVGRCRHQLVPTQSLVPGVRLVCFTHDQSRCVYMCVYT